MLVEAPGAGCEAGLLRVYKVCRLCYLGLKPWLVKRIVLHRLRSTGKARKDSLQCPAECFGFSLSGDEKDWVRIMQAREAMTGKVVSGSTSQVQTLVPCMTIFHWSSATRPLLSFPERHSSMTAPLSLSRSAVEHLQPHTNHRYSMHEVKYTPLVIEWKVC